MAGFGVYPSGVSPFGLSTPLPAGNRATGQAGSRFINPATRDYEQDPATGQLAQMPTTRQRVLLAVLTLVRSSTVFGSFGIKLPRKMGTFFTTEMTQAVRSALKHLTDEGAIRIDSIEVERSPGSRSRTTINYTDLVTGKPDVPVTFSTPTMADLFVPPNADYLKGQFLRDVRLAAIDSGLDEPPTTPGTDWDLLGTGIANMGLLGFANINASEDDLSLLKATGQALDDIRVAEGQPEVPAAGGTGKIIVTVAGSTTITDGQTFLYPSGLTGKVVGTYVNPADQDEINVQAVDTGTNTNLRSGETVRFRNPPINLATEAKVSFGEPIVGGTDAESNDRKRARILNVRRNRPAGGNWAHIRKVALDALGTVQDCYVIPGLGGPGSAKVVPVKDFNVEQGDFSRTIPSTALNVVRGAIQAELPSQNEIVVQASANQPVDCTVLLTIPESSLSGGNGRGWTDQQVWPPLVVADSNRVTITVVSAGNDVITVDAATLVAPIAGQTHIAWWSAVDRKFITALVTGVAGATTAWVLTLDRPLVGKTGAGPSAAAAKAGDYISPAAQNLDKYGDAWVELFRALGPGENVLSSDARIPRSLRHPFVTDEDPSSLTNVALGTLRSTFTEITDYAYGYRSTSSPTVPGLVATAPNILIPQRLAFYKQT